MFFKRLPIKYILMVFLILFVIGCEEAEYSKDEPLDYIKRPLINSDINDNLLTANQSSIKFDISGFSAFNNAEILRQTDEYLLEDASLKCITPGVDGEEGFFVDSIELEPSNTYTASLYVKGNGVIRFFYTERDALDNYISGEFVVINLTETWTRYSITLEHGENGVKGRIWLRTPPDNVQSITWYTDGLKIEQSRKPTSWVIGQNDQ